MDNAGGVLEDRRRLKGNAPDSYIGRIKGRRVEEFIEKRGDVTSVRDKDAD
jgi:hypothetical protein